MTRQVEPGAGTNETCFHQKSMVYNAIQSLRWQWCEEGLVLWVGVRAGTNSTAPQPTGFLGRCSWCLAAASLQPGRRQ